MSMKRGKNRKKYYLCILKQNMLFRMKQIIEKYSDKISFTLDCYDRIILRGSLPHISYAQGMTTYLYAHQIGIFDYSHFAEPYKEMINTHIKELSQSSSIPIEFVSKKSIRKESMVSKKLEELGTSPCIVCILSAMETCPTYQP
jgi:hypothetical protein